MENISVFKYFINQFSPAKPFILAECLPFTFVHLKINYPRNASEANAGAGANRYADYLLPAVFIMLFEKIIKSHSH